MPGPAVYILAIVGTMAVGFAVKEFLYEPYIAPKLEEWAEDFLKRRCLAGAHQCSYSDDTSSSSSGASAETKGCLATSNDFELKAMLPPRKGVHEWREDVDRRRSSLRLRKSFRQGGSNLSLSPEPVTHVLIDPSSPASTISSSRVATHPSTPLLVAPPVLVPVDPDPAPALISPSPRSLSLSHPSPLDVDLDFASIASSERTPSPVLPPAIDVTQVTAPSVVDSAAPESSGTNSPALSFTSFAFSQHNSTDGRAVSGPVLPPSSPVEMPPIRSPSPLSSWVSDEGLGSEPSELAFSESSWEGANGNPTFQSL
ncbi:hypothetical protein FISHEDRAFT_72948 [Fistulina hepatica ATCC 64428]|uniref:Uncharacterized protein n=1 Tax=Fistulina hepatica ATCC 64428 TaxID=1128425 RepID=A0A0D7AFG8_9AGAR|nr:hypothetical protein FISHEDRAFT_72948 [Fistulina hepatica ATCC 64428]